MPKLDDAAYQEGRRAFESGASLRSIIEQVDEEPDDVVFLSSAVGFADAFLEMCCARAKPPRIINPELPDAGAVFKQA